MNFLLDINIKLNKFLIVGDIDVLYLNRRIKLYLRNKSAKTSEGFIEIPYNRTNKLETLQDLENLFEKFNLDYKQSNNIKRELYRYNKEKENFSLFTEKAIKIRNNEFKSDQELIADFEEFKNVVEKNMIRKMYPLQLLSAFHMAFSQNSCNFAVPGAGKTTIAYGAYTYLRNLQEENPKYVDKLMVIGPISSFAPWENEYEECFNNSVSSQRMSGDSSISKDTKLEHLYSTSPKELTLIAHAGVSNYEKEIIDFLKTNKTMLIIDEAHRIKNPDGVWGQSITNISKYACARVILTGTPVPNGYEDLYNLYKFIYPHKYKDILRINYNQMKNLTLNEIGINNERVAELTNNIKPYFIRIRKKDLNLPDVEEKSLKVEMDPLQKEIYDFIESKYIYEFQNNSSGTVKDLFNKARLIRLRQASINPGLLLKTISENLEDKDTYIEYDINSLDSEIITDSEIYKKIKEYALNNTPMKFINTFNLVEKITKNGRKVLIWTIFIQNAEDLQKYLIDKGIKAELLIGRIPTVEREKIVAKFNNPQDREFNVVIANPFSVSESISLHKGCHNAIYLERDYNCANFIQSKDRIHRVGLNRDTITKYYYMITKNSVDSIVHDKLEKKIKRMEEIINHEIPLFNILKDDDETDIIKELINKYLNVERTYNI